MPFYRRRYRKKYSKKAYRAKWKSKRKGKGEYGVRYMKLRQHVSMNTSGAGVYTGDFSVRNPSNAQDWNNCAALFDEYKVCAYKVQFVPHIPAGNSTTVDYRPVYITFDTDSTATPITSMSDCLEYENLKVMNLFRPWKHYMIVPKIVTEGNTLGYQSTQQPTDRGRLTVYAESLDFSAFYGDMIISYYIKFKARK